MPYRNSRPFYRDPYILIPAIVAILAAAIGILPNLTGNRSPDFSISVKPMQGSAQQGGVIQATISVKGIHGYEHPVSLNTTGQPSGVVVDFNPPSGDASSAYTSTMLINVNSEVPAGDYTIITKGTGADGKEHSCKYNLTVKSSVPATTSTSPATTLQALTTTTTTAASKPMRDLSVSDLFYPSGWMGDGEQGLLYIKLNTGSKETFHSAPTSNKITYQPGPNGWAGMFWQYPDSNWGDRPGRNLKGYAKLVFWAKGEKGGEVVEFKTGGIMNTDKPYRDSLEKSIGKITLTNDWKEYIIDLTGEDLSNVIGAFAWVATRDDNPEGLTFYLDDISYKQ